ncbi:CoA transferase [Lachnospiraceae bacterium NSJ-143]|nr:CoA transferase [Lachnospiraceae bacterium NSJ-143]
MGILDGVKVIDFTHAYSGPFCTLNLANFGAEVIKVERINGGDQSRSWAPIKNGYSGYYASFNRGKKSITLDIASEEGKKIIFDLIKGADIVCSNFKVGTLERYGIGYEDMKKVKPDIIYATISGFGNKGALSKYAAYDIVIQAMSGIMDVNGFADGGPTKVGPAIGDSYTGLILLLGIITAYYNRLKTGKGQKVDATMLGSLFSMLEYPILEYANADKIISRSGNACLYYAPDDIYKVKDGYIALSVKSDELWKEFCSKIGLTNSDNIKRFNSNEERIKLNDELKVLLETHMADMTRQEVEERLKDIDIAVSGVIGIEEALEDEHLKARNMVIDVVDPMLGKMKLVGNPMNLSENPPPEINSPSPLLGENTVDIMKSLGYNENEIEELQLKKVI